MGHCKDCVHWQLSPEQMQDLCEYLAGRLPGPPILHTFDESYRECHSGKILYSPHGQYNEETCQYERRNAPFAPDGAAFSDWENYGADFECGPDFGCVHFRQREE